MKFDESVIAMYRYSGFAVRSVMKNRTKSDDKSESKVLELLKCKHEDLEGVPSPGRDLASSPQFCIISPKVIPYVQLLSQIVTSNIGEEHLLAEGQDMVKMAKSEVASQQTRLSEKFIQRIESIDRNTAVKLSASSIELIRADITSKIINARINEFFKAKKELDLEANKKVVDCDQSLRDTLKVFSSMKSRV